MTTNHIYALKFKKSEHSFVSKIAANEYKNTKPNEKFPLAAKCSLR
jgi:hypothetical protein